MTSVSLLKNQDPFLGSNGGSNTHHTNDHHLNSKFSQPHASQPQSSRQYTMLILLAVGIGFLSSLLGLIQPAIEGLDGSHNVMDGLFFYDLFKNDSINLLSYDGLTDYVMEYKARHPALGFLYWPPLWPLVESVFFSLFGVSLLSAQLSVLCFTFIFAVSYANLINRIMSPILTLASLLVILMLPEVFYITNTIMRDMPAMACMMLSVWCYCRWLEQPDKLSRLWLTGFIIIAGVYVKQTTFISGLAIGLHFLLNYAFLLRRKSVLGLLLTSIIALLPLIVFTLVVARVNLEQSIGTSTQSIMQGYEGLQRFSMQAWLYYPRALAQQSLLIAILGISGIIHGLIQVYRHKVSGVVQLLTLWSLIFYVCFSYFDNRADRFLTIWLPAIVPLAFWSCMHIKFKFFSQLIPRRYQTISLAITLLILVSVQSWWRIVNDPFPRYSKIDTISQNIIRLTANDNKANFIGYIGSHHQLFVQSLRRLQPNHQGVAIKPLETQDDLAYFLKEKVLPEFKVEPLGFLIKTQSPLAKAAIQKLKNDGYTNTTHFAFNGPNSEQSMIFLQQQ